MRAKQQRKLDSCAHNMHRVYVWPCERSFNYLLLPVQICFIFRGSANLFAPGFKFAPECKLCTWSQNVLFLYILIGDSDMTGIFYDTNTIYTN